MIENVPHGGRIRRPRDDKMTDDQDKIALERPALMTIRKAVESDIPQLLEMIGLLSAFHDDPSEMTAESLKRDLFGPTP